MRTIAISTLLLAGCIANDGLGSSGTAENNIYKLSRVSLGMNEGEVLQIMRHPYSEERFCFENDVYDVWFYVTRMTTLGQSRMVPINLTPLTFKNGVLVGWGYDYYNMLVEKNERMGEDTTPKKQADEDIKLEKILAPPKAAVSMSKKPKNEEPPPTTPTEEKEKQERPKIDKGDEEMLEEENEEDFQYW